MEVVGFGPASEPDIMFVMVLYGSLNANVEMDFQLIVSVKPIVEFAKWVVSVVLQRMPSIASQARLQV
jgi:hypothetical protein